MALERRLYESLDQFESREIAYELGFCFDAGALAQLTLDGTWLSVPYTGGELDDATSEFVDYAGGLL